MRGSARFCGCSRSAFERNEDPGKPGVFVPGRRLYASLSRRSAVRGQGHPYQRCAAKSQVDPDKQSNGPQRRSGKANNDDGRDQQVHQTRKQHPRSANQFAPMPERVQDGSDALGQEVSSQDDGQRVRALDGRNQQDHTRGNSDESGQQ